MDLLTATPVEIDTVLSRLYEESGSISVDLMMVAERMMSTAKLHTPGARVDRWTTTTEGTLDDAIAILTKQVEEAGSSRFSGAEYSAKLLSERKRLLEAKAANRTAQAPLHAEFERRGGWTRSFLVLNTGGHAHSSMNCTTCFLNTRYGWLVELSGSTEEQIVEGVGEQACTVCYPTAPVNPKPRTYFHHTEITAQQERAARDQAKADRAAKKAARAIANPDGSPLSVFDYHIGERRQEMRDGSIKVTPAYDRFTTIETLAAAKSWLTDSFDGYTGRRTEDIDKVSEAIAHKLGTSAQDEQDNAKKRASKRR